MCTRTDDNNTGKDHDADSQQIVKSANTAQLSK